MLTLKRILATVCAVSVLTACASTTLAPQIYRTPPAAALTPCQDLPEAADGKLSTILRNSLERARMYHECQSRQAELTEWVLR